MAEQIWIGTQNLTGRGAHWLLGHFEHLFLVIELENRAILIESPSVLGQQLGVTVQEFRGPTAAQDLQGYVEAHYGRIANRRTIDTGPPVRDSLPLIDRFILMYSDDVF